MKQIVCTFDVLFLAVSSTLDESSSTRSSRRRVPPKLDTVWKGCCTTIEGLLIVDNAEPHRLQFPLLSMIFSSNEIHEIPPSSVPSRFCLFLRNFRASVREARVNNVPSYRGYGRLCAIDVVPTALSAAAPRDWRGRRSCQTFSKERLCRYLCRERVSIIYVYTCTQLSISDYRTLLR